MASASSDEAIRALVRTIRSRNIDAISKEKSRSGGDRVKASNGLTALQTLISKKTNSDDEAASFLINIAAEIRWNIDVTSRGEKANALHLASTLNRPAVVEALLRAPGVEGRLEAKTTSGDTPLVRAINSRSYECAKLLLGNGADPNAIDKYGNTAIMLACKVGDARGVRILLKHGAKYVINTCGSSLSESSLSPLLAAVRVHSVECVSELLGAGADIMHVKRATGEGPESMIDGYNALLLAAKFAFKGTEILLALLHHLKLPMASAQKKVVSARHALSAVTKNIGELEEEANEAQRQGYIDTAEQARTGLRSLHVLEEERKHNLRLAEEIFEDSKNEYIKYISSTRDVYGNCPIHLTVKCQSEHAVRLLLLNGCDVNIRNKHGETPLMLASKMGLLKIANILVCEFKADVSLRDRKRKDAFFLALQYKKHRVATFLKSR